MTDKPDQENHHHWCVYWCCYLNKDDTKPWHQRTNCGRITLSGLLYVGYFIIAMMGIYSFLGFTTVISYGFQTVYGIPNCTVTDWELLTDCSPEGLLSILAMLAHMLATFPIVLMTAYIYLEINRLLCKCRWNQYFNCESIIGWILNVIWIVVWASFSIFLSPYLDRIFYYNAPCNLAQYYTTRYDDNYCIGRGFLGILFVDGILAICFFIARRLFLNLEQWQQEVIADQGSTTPPDQTTVELQTDPQTDTVEIAQTDGSV